MPPVVAALVAVGIDAFIATLLVNFAISTAISFVVGSFTKPRTGGYTAQQTDRTHVIRSSVASRNIIYGTAQTSGPLVFVASTDKGTDKNKYLHLVIALAAHECNAVTDVLFNDVSIGPLDGNGFVATGKFAPLGSPQTSESFSIADGQISFTLAHTPNNVLSITYSSPYGDGSEGGGIPSYFGEASVVGNTLVFPNSINGFPIVGYGVTIQYTYSEISAQLVRIKTHLGSPSQAADADLVAECPTLWTAAHRLQGICYLYVRLEYDSNAFVTGIPNIKAVVQGKKVLDPRDGVTKFTNNYALCMNDYMTSADGLGCSVSDIDQATLIASANVCDEQVPPARYTVDGVVLLDHTPEENIRQLSTSSGGPAPVLAGATFFIHVGSYDVPTVTLTESDLRGPVKVQARRARKDLFNAVKGTYIESVHGQPVDYPMVKNALYQSQDGQQITRDFQMPFVTDPTRAQRLAKIVLERSRQGISIEFPCKASGFQLRAWDTVYVSLAKFGFVNKVFRVTSWTFNTNGTIDLLLTEEAAGVYAWNNGEATTVDLAIDTLLPNPYVVDALTNLVLTSGASELVLTADGTVVSRLHARWNKSVSSINYQGGNIEVQYKRSIDAAWIQLPPLDGAATDAYIVPVKEGDIMLVRIRAISNRGAYSDWTYSQPHTIIGKSEPPANVKGFSGTRQETGFLLNWTQNADIDIDRYRIKIGGGDWQSAAAVAETFSNSLFVKLPVAGTYTLRVKAIDTSNIESLVDATHIAVVPSPDSVVTFNIEGNTLTWGAVNSFALAGYRIKFQYGQNRSWSDATPLHTGVLTQSPYTPDTLPQGPLTLLIKAVDVNGNESAAAAIIQTQFGNVIVANIVESIDFKALGFPGTLTGGMLSGTSLVSTSIANFYADPASQFYSAYESSLFFNDYFSAMVYETPLITPSRAALGSNMTLVTGITGDLLKIEYRVTGGNLMYPNVGTEPFFGSDSSYFYGDPGTYQAWPGQIGVSNLQYQFRLTTGQSTTQGVISALSESIDVPDVLEKLNNIVIASTGTRLPILKKYQTILNVQLTLEADGGTAFKPEIVDKDALLGPLIQCRNASGSLVSGTVDAVVQGY